MTMDPTRRMSDAGLLLISSSLFCFFMIHNCFLFKFIQIHRILGLDVGVVTMFISEFIFSELKSSFSIQLIFQQMLIIVVGSCKMKTFSKNLIYRYIFQKPILGIRVKKD